jgi:hypothetical protein
MPSYRSICRFISSVKPLLGIWVHQNPELGNLVYVTWGFLSVVGCRIIPQELGPEGLDKGLLWAPVFEIVSASEDGSLAFFLHGRENERDCCYPGCFSGSRADSNVLLLEAEPRCQFGSPFSHGDASDAMEADDGDGSVCPDDIWKFSRPPKSREALPGSGAIPFHRLQFADRRKMLDVIARYVRLKIPASFVEPLFPRVKNRARAVDMDGVSMAEEIQKEASRLADRRSLLLKMYSHGDPHGRRPPTSTHYNGPNSNDILEKICSSDECTSGSLANLKAQDGIVTNKGKEIEAAASPSDSSSSCTSSSTGELVDAQSNGGQSQLARKPRLAMIIRERMKQIIGMGKAEEAAKISDRDGKSGSAAKRVVHLQQFLRQGETVALRLHALHWELKTYRAWPLMPDNRFALYKMPEQLPVEGREHAGLWGGTFGWPPGKLTDDKPGKALYFLLLSYDDTKQGRFLIATKILEGTHYVLHPNGSPMFIVNVDIPSTEAFPWHTDRDGAPVDVVRSYQGEGIANGYGFRYPSSKPGDLFVDSNGSLAFVWRESQNVLALQRLNLQDLLEKGDRVAPLAPIANYTYLIKSLSNVFAGFCGLTNRR